MTGLGCSPVLVSGTKPVFLKWIGKALREGLIRIPRENGSITWKLPDERRSYVVDTVERRVGLKNPLSQFGGTGTQILVDILR